MNPDCYGALALVAAIAVYAIAVQMDARRLINRIAELEAREAAQEPDEDA